MLNGEKYLLVPLVTLILCQIIKFGIESVKTRKLKWGRLFNGSGGMPSSHTSLATSLTVMIGLNSGFNSSLFAISLVFTLIVAYDAMGLRRESGRQAATINMIMDEIFEGHPGEGYQKLKEQIGHQPLEVLGGIILGTLTSCIFTFIIL